MVRIQERRGRARLRRLRETVAAACGVALLLTSCAVPAKRAADADEVDALYATIDIAVGKYRDGLHQMREGETDKGHALMEAAAAELAADGNRCVMTPGCEPQRFMAAYGNLLALRSRTLADAVEDFEVIEPREGTTPLLADLPEANRSIGLLNGVRLDQVIKVNGPIKAALQDWLTWMRPLLIDAYENYEYMRYLMWPAYEEAGLPEALLFGILAKESGGKVHAVSSAGAAGPFQFMYHTGLRFGLRTENGFDLRYDPQAATRANVAYLNERFKELNHNLEFALAAYNGGEGRMKRIAQRSRSKSFWAGDVIAHLPRETQEYVPYVLAAAWLFLHPEDYGLEFPRVDGKPGAVTLAGARTLNELTVCLGQAGSRYGWYRTLRNLNPRIDPNKPIPAGTTVAMPAFLTEIYAQQCVDGRMAQLATELQRARVPGSVASGGGRKYIVRAGDTLASIAKRQGCSSPQALARVNNIRGPRYLIRPAQELTLAGCNA
jgi:membrane-bound lytic murein transglycosylase D